VENSANSGMDSYRLKESECPTCKHVLDAATGEAGETPKNGDFSICFYCGEILRFKGEEGDIAIAENEDLQELRRESEETYDQVYSCQRMIRFRRAQMN